MACIFQEPKCAARAILLRRSHIRAGFSLRTRSRCRYWSLIGQHARGAVVLPVTNVSLPSIAKNAIVAAAGDYVWANLGYSVERLDVVHGSNRVTTLPAGVDEAGALTGTADGALWYSGCQTLGPVATGGVGFISAAGAARFFASALMPLLVCPNLALAPDGNIWFSNELQLAKMTPAGSFAAVKVHPRRTDQTGLSNIVFANDGTMWMISGRPDNAGSLIHIAQSGSVLGAYGHEKFLTVATDSSSRLYTIGWTAISVYNLSGVLQSTYTPQGGTLQKTVQTVTRDGALWFGIGYDSFRTNALVGRIAPDGSMFEFSIQADGGTMPALAATGDGSRSGFRGPVRRKCIESTFRHASCLSRARPIGASVV